MGPHAASRPLTLSEQADELEEKMMNELNDKDRHQIGAVQHWRTANLIISAAPSCRRVIRASIS